jgi:hypothetical protein
MKSLDPALSKTGLEVKDKPKPAVDKPQGTWPPPLVDTRPAHDNMTQGQKVQWINGYFHKKVGS